MTIFPSDSLPGWRHLLLWAPWQTLAFKGTVISAQQIYLLGHSQRGSHVQEVQNIPFYTEGVPTCGQESGKREDPYV